MAAISKDLLKKLVNEGFFDTHKYVEDVVSRLDQKGFSITGRKISLLSQLLAFLCQEDILIREKDEQDKWRYKKR